MEVREVWVVSYTATSKQAGMRAEQEIVLQLPESLRDAPDLEVKVCAFKKLVEQESGG